MLRALALIGPEPFLMRYGGEPGLRLGVGYEYSGIVFSGDMKQGMNLNDTRRRGEELVFGDGKRWNKPECWVLCVRLIKPTHTVAFRTDSVIPITPILRDDTTTCPICISDLSGVIISCSNKHQVCCECYGLMGNSPKCPICRQVYDADAQTTYTNRIGTRETVYEEIQFYFGNGANSRLMAYGADCLFLHYLKRYGADMLHKPKANMLIDLLLNYYLNPKVNKDTGFYDGMITYPSRGHPYSRSYTKWTAQNSPNGLDRFLVYLRSEDAKEKIKNVEYYINDYSEDHFLTDLEKQYPESALSVLRNNATPAQRSRLKRGLYWSYRVIGNNTDEEILSIIDECEERSRTESLLKCDTVYIRENYLIPN